MYHAVGSSALGDIKGLYSISPELFKSQMQFIDRNLSGNLISIYDDSCLNDSLRIGVSFDDGYQDNLEIAAPILHELNIPFTVFITADFVKNSKKGFLSVSDVRQLIDYAGASIGAHGAGHVDLTQCNSRQLDYELVSSKCYLEDITGNEVNALSYPFGKVNNNVKRVALSTGYTKGLSSLPVINTATQDPMLLGRTEIHNDDEIKVFDQKINGCWDWMRFIR